ncbi:MAG: PilZ domain-containing protein [Gammaproteobacteria bacterium]
MHTFPTAARNGATRPPASFVDPARLDAIHNDFIPHPATFPLRYRRHGGLPWRQPSPGALAGDVGVSFHSPRYFAPGTRIDLEIPLRGITQRFLGTVVLVREEPAGYEIGLWFTDPADASRARLVERICHTECYLRTRRPA